MKYPFKPEQTYIVVFCFFALGAGCKAVGEYALDRLESDAPGEEVLLQDASADVERLHIWVQNHRAGADLENLPSASSSTVDSFRAGE